MKNKFIILSIILITIVPLLSSDKSYLNLDKLKKITEKKNKKITEQKQEKIKKPEIINPRFIPTKIKNDNKTEEAPLIKPDFLGMVVNSGYKAVLLKYNEQYLYLREGEIDTPTKIKIIKIEKNKITLKINNKKIDLEVEDE